jgi:biopolymer transport protein ExbB/TolQ
MPRFFLQAGPLIWPIALLSLVILGLALWNAIALLTGRSRSYARRRQSVDGVLFWGGVAALLGFLGQWLGIARMTEAIARAGIVSPTAIAIGISESLLTPISGMAVLTVAAFCWFFLRLGLWSVERRAT